MRAGDLKHLIRDLDDDDQVLFVAFDYSQQLGYHFRLLNQTIRHDGDPHTVIALSLSHTGITADSLQEMAAIAAQFSRMD